MCTQTMKVYAPIITSNCVMFKCRASHFTGFFMWLLVSVFDAVRFNPEYFCAGLQHPLGQVVCCCMLSALKPIFIQLFPLWIQDALRNSKQPEFVIFALICDEHLSVLCWEMGKQFLIQKIFLLFCFSFLFVFFKLWFTLMDYILNNNCLCWLFICWARPQRSWEPGWIMFLVIFHSWYNF